MKTIITTPPHDRPKQTSGKGEGMVSLSLSPPRDLFRRLPNTPARMNEWMNGWIYGFLNG